MAAGIGYKWMLRRGSRKEVCPQCGQRRFVPYVLAADGVTIARDDAGRAIYGRCDREDNCGYYRYPHSDCTVEAGAVRVEPKHEQPLRFSPSAVKMDVRTNLFTYAAGLFGVSRTLEAWERYKVGRDGTRTVFWQIARDGSIRAGKSIPYLTNGHRDKADKYPASWLHKCGHWDAYRSGAELQQCYFGEHLLDKFPDKKVVVVESEKTAMLMSCVSNCLWLAAGGSQGVKNEKKNEALKGRDVWLFPDNGQYWSWRGVAEKYGWGVFNQMEVLPIFEGCDIWDVMELHLKLRKHGDDGLF